MRRLLPILVVAGVLSAAPAFAVSIDLNLSSASASTLLDSLVAGPLTSGYQFGASGPDGTVTSVVYSGKGDAAGLFVYMYQIAVTGNPTISGLVIDYFRAPATFAGSTGAFYDATFDGGSVAPNSAVFDTAIPTSVGFSYNPNTLPAGTTAYYVGVFSPHRPGVVTASLLGSGGQTVFPSVYSAVPEPGVVTLLGLGLASLGLGGLWKKRRRE